MLICAPRSISAPGAGRAWIEISAAFRLSAGSVALSAVSETFCSVLAAPLVATTI